jgi:hypothetical protein
MASDPAERSERARVAWPRHPRTGRDDWQTGEVVADDGVAAVVAEGPDLLEPAPDAAATAVGVLVEVGLERV